jgi:hypothetical protein
MTAGREVESGFGTVLLLETETQTWSWVVEVPCVLAGPWHSAHNPWTLGSPSGK